MKNSKNTARGSFLGLAHQFGDTFWRQAYFSIPIRTPSKGLVSGEPYGIRTPFSSLCRKNRIGLLWPNPEKKIHFFHQILFFRECVLAGFSEDHYFLQWNWIGYSFVVMKGGHIDESFDWIFWGMVVFFCLKDSNCFIQSKIHFKLKLRVQTI